MSLIPETAPLSSSAMTREAAPVQAGAVRRGARWSTWVLAVACAWTLGVALWDWGAQWSNEVAVPFATASWLGQAPAVATATPWQDPPDEDLSAVDPLADGLARLDQMQSQSLAPLLPRQTQRPLGADRQGRDVGLKVARGGAVSLGVAWGAALLATAIGGVLGAWAGWAGGLWDEGLEWLYSVWMALPALLLALAVSAWVGRGVGPLVLVLGCTGWGATYRVMRTAFRQLRHRDFVRASAVMGASPGQRAWHHIAPNVAPVALVQFGLSVVSFLKAEMVLSYLGLGVDAHQVSWGTMLAESQSEVMQGQVLQLLWVSLAMGLFILAQHRWTDAQIHRGSAGGVSW